MANGDAAAGEGGIKAMGVLEPAAADAGLRRAVGDLMRMTG